ncbi:MAG: hypothetical protein EPO27_02260 [Betaproteobacteria bacterium]|nr:MAG: hypothetical protein EPO27_02260 [Betaproteobacteria bacterium]
MNQARPNAPSRGQDFTPPLLRGLSWTALGLVLGFCAIAALEVVAMPSKDAFYSGIGDMARSALARIPVFLVGGVTLLVTAIVFLNAAGRTDRERFGQAVLAAVLGSVVAAVTRYLVGATPATEGAAFILKVFVAWLIPALALAAGCVLYLRAHAAREELNNSVLRRASLEQQRQEARLRLLQAQIEPHFLFNTLSNIRRLCQTDAAAGRRMLAQLTRYLRAALPKFRVEEATLADEIEIVAAYLGLQKTRMGERLRFEIDVPPELRGVRVPPMMLATLVENAIKHGIAPLAEGGSIRVRAAAAAGALTLEVTDDGRGFAAGSGSGVGLANIRARLNELHGGRAALLLEAAAPRGVVATITLPLQRAAGAP